MRCLAHGRHRLVWAALAGSDGLCRDRRPERRGFQPRNRARHRLQRNPPDRLRMAGDTHRPGDHRSSVLHRRGRSHNRGRGIAGAGADARGVDFRVRDRRPRISVRTAVPERRPAQRALRPRLSLRMVPQRPAKLLLLHARLPSCGCGPARAPATLRVRTVGHRGARQRRHRFGLHSLACANEAHGFRGGRRSRRTRRGTAGQPRPPDPLQRGTVQDRRFARAREHSRHRRPRFDFWPAARRIVD